MGHEITHGFDNSGRLFDGNGNLRDWWDNQTSENFKTKKKCFIEQYGSVEIPIQENFTCNDLIRALMHLYIIDNIINLKPNLKYSLHINLLFITFFSLIKKWFIYNAHF